MEVDDYVKYLEENTIRYKIPPKSKDMGKSYFRRFIMELINMGIEINNPLALIPDTRADASTIRMIAHACHERNRQFCIQNNEQDLAPAWEIMNEELKAATINGVEFTLEKMRENEMRSSPLPLNGAFVQIQAKLNHENWCIMKQSQGWVYGPKKDFALKTHHCLVSYDKLPASQKMKDFLFISEVAHFYMALQSDVYALRHQK